MSYIYDGLIDNLKKEIERYYDSVSLDPNPSIHNNIHSSGVYYYTDMVEVEVISTLEKITKLRDLTISKIIDETCDLELINKEIEEINKKEEVDDDCSNHIPEVKVIMKSKILHKIHFDFEMESMEHIDRVFYMIIKNINKELMKLIEDVEEVDVNNSHELQKTQYKWMGDNRTGHIKYGMSSYTKGGLILNELNIGGSEKFIIVPQNKPLIFLVQNVDCVQSVGLRGNSYRVRVTYFLDLIADVSECKIINLTDQFFNSLY